MDENAKNPTYDYLFSMKRYSFSMIICLTTKSEEFVFY